MCVHQYEFMDIYFVLCVIIQYYTIYFGAQIVPAWAFVNSLTWFCDLLTYHINLLVEQFLIFQHSEQIYATLIYFLPQS